MSYTYSTLLVSAPTGPYQLTNWTINGVNHSFTFNNIADLVAQMNSVDNNSWTLNTNNQTIEGGQNSNVYGKMFISKNGTNVAMLELNTQVIPTNIALLLNTGVHFIHIQNEDTGCEYDLKISVQCDSASVTLIAVDDKYNLPKKHSMMMNVINNDIIPIALEAFQIIEYPKHGHLVMHPNNMVEYIQDDEECDITDSFQYLVSNGYTSDIATVTIYIACEDLVVFNGISPNDDGLNDKLIIQGIEKYKDNNIEVFNRWGNKVYSKKGYDNNDPWDATWDGKMLPDGTYYYFIDNGEGKTYNGYLQVQR
jgi:gliding motility-associated-like protein